MESSAAESKEEGIGQNSFKPGQKFPTPSPGSGDRVFYDTLLQQRPESEMAQEWCVSHGTLELEEAIKLYRLICKRKNREFDFQPTSSTVKKPTTQRTSTGKSKIVDETNDTIDTGSKSNSSLSLPPPLNYSLLPHLRSRGIVHVGRTRHHRIVEIICRNSFA